MRRLLIPLAGALLVLGLTTPHAVAKENRIELNSMSLVNDHRKAEKIKTMKRQACLQRHAEVHAKRMAAKGKLYHRTSSALRTVMKRCKLTSIGENIARGTKMTSPQAVSGWMRSSGHRANIMKPSFNRIGAAYRTGSKNQRYWIQLYGKH